MSTLYRETTISVRLTRSPAHCSENTSEGHASGYARPRLSFIVIGRNEGYRLRRCLESVIGNRATVVYVDSGSTDGSVTMARELGAHVVELDGRIPFTAARARNAGRGALASLNADVKYIQFVDGDCEIEWGWINAAVKHFEERKDVAIVCGHLQERRPEASIYNRLCAMEWRSVAGETASTGGIFMVRTNAFDEVDGFRDTMVAGEEPEMCQRLRDKGWRIWRLGVPMANHDAEMTRFAQWWTRSIRSGHGYAELAWLHRHSPARPWRREVIRNWFWGLALPAASLALAWLTSGLSLLLLALYPIWVAKIALNRVRRMNDALSHAMLYGVFCMIGKFAGMIGQCVFMWRRIRGRQSTLFEYKSIPQDETMKV